LSGKPNVTFDIDYEPLTEHCKQHLKNSIRACNKPSDANNPNKSGVEIEAGIHGECRFLNDLGHHNSRPTGLK
jgi:hypothetical protein